MQQEIRFATFNVCNLAPAGAKLYDNLLPSTQEEYEAKLNWTAQQIDRLDADVIGFQEIFSQAVLQDVLKRTRKYREAVQVGFDPDPGADRYTPSVALVSRLPLAGPGVAYTYFPAGVEMPPGSRDPNRFSRPVVHAAIQATPDCIVDVLVVHLKSKRPDYRNGDTSEDPLLFAQASLRSLIRRGTEAVALRVLLSNLSMDGGKETGLRGRRPRVVLGDFNDVADSVTTTIVMGNGMALAERMFDASQLQRRPSQQQNVGFSQLHEGQYSTIDHILVSEEFNAALPNAVGEVVDVIYLNDHLVLSLPEASDHGQVMARVRLFDETHGLSESEA